MDVYVNLKPCPFCGGNVNMVFGAYQGIAMIVCNHCGAIVSFSGRESDVSAAIAYNKRFEE